MSEQKKISSLLSLNSDEREKIKKILDLEKKYFNELWKLFSSISFINDLKKIEEEIIENYIFLTKKVWNLKNKIKIPAERLTRFYVYSKLSNIIKFIYPSPISSDVAFITEDAIINLDIKTLDIIGNRGDIGNLQFENNQSSFENKNLDCDENYPNSGVKVECLLPKENKCIDGVIRPILTFFLTIIYKDDSNSFELSKDENYPTIQLKCLPNGFLSKLFEYDIVQNFKTYSYFKNEENLEPIFLTKNKDEVTEKIEKFIEEHSEEYVLIKGRQKLGVYSIEKEHPYYDTLNLSYFPVVRKNGVFLEAVINGNTNRVLNKTLVKRYDSLDNYWEGIKKITIS
jgi:hypothetical protein